jgi:hypothetical protein
MDLAVPDGDMRFSGFEALTGLLTGGPSVSNPSESIYSGSVNPL